MSIFLPYSPEIVLTTFTDWFSLDLTSLSSYETLVLTLLSNIYFFGFWFCIMYFVFKGFNRIYERIF